MAGVVYVRRRWTTVRTEYAALDAAPPPDAAALPDPERADRHRLTSIVQFSPCSPTFSKPTRWYIIRERLCTATDSESDW